MKSRDTGPIVPFGLSGQLLAPPLKRAVRSHVIDVPGFACGSTPERTQRQTTRTRDNHKFTIAPPRSTPRAPPLTRQGPVKSCPCRATTTSRMLNLAFHARLIELALQAGIAAGPQMRGDRMRRWAVNALGPEACEDQKRTCLRNERAVAFEVGQRRIRTNS